jgi:hypothetical protein
MMMKMKICIPHASQAAPVAAADHDVVARGGGGGSTKDARGSEASREVQTGGNERGRAAFRGAPRVGFDVLAEPLYLGVEEEWGCQ